MTRRKEDLTTFNSSEEGKTKLWFCMVFTYFISKRQPVSGFAKG